MEDKRDKRGRISRGLHRFIWGPEVEIGDCIFYTILSEILLALIWLFTFERIGIHVRYSLIPWAGIVYPDLERIREASSKGKRKRAWQQ